MERSDRQCEGRRYGVPEIMTRLTNKNKQPIATRWYVYNLIDPRDDAVFYVGKGSSRSIRAQEQEARCNNCDLSPKLERIHEI